jgi:hypothetical protein
LGGNGKTGWRVVQRLAARGVPTRIGSTLEEHAAEAAEHGVPPEVVELLTYLFSEVVDGRNAATTDGVRRALGRDPRDFTQYARGAAATGDWNASAAAA